MYEIYGVAARMRTLIYEGCKILCFFFKQG